MSIEFASALNQSKAAPRNYHLRHLDLSQVTYGPIYGPVYGPVYGSVSDEGPPVPQNHLGLAGAATIGYGLEMNRVLKTLKIARNGITAVQDQVPYTDPYTDPYLICGVCGVRCTLVVRMKGIIWDRSWTWYGMSISRSL